MSYFIVWFDYFIILLNAVQSRRIGRSISAMWDTANVRSQINWEEFFEWFDSIVNIVRLIMCIRHYQPQIVLDSTSICMLLRYLTTPKANHRHFSNVACVIVCDVRSERKNDKVALSANVIERWIRPANDLCITFTNTCRVSVRIFSLATAIFFVIFAINR